MKQWIAALPLVVWAACAIAAPTAPAVHAEIDALVNRLQSSGCDFNRNGSWYTGAEARAHLLKKLEYLEGKEAVQSAEQFIEVGASTSSMSGKPYLVRCGNGVPVPSNTWLTAELKAQRARGAANSASRPK